eukprot:9689846-Alexandrium_andersonii.AAC.1
MHPVRAPPAPRVPGTPRVPAAGVIRRTRRAALAGLAPAADRLPQPVQAGAGRLHRQRSAG